MKHRKSREKIFLTITVCFSLLGLFFINVLILQKGAHTANLFNRNLVGLFFSGLCIWGIGAAFYPDKCQKIASFAAKNSSTNPTSTVQIRMKGHHPDCKSFAGNRFKIGKFTFCSACSGLVFGAIAVLFAGALYFFAGYNFINDLWFLVLAELGIVVGLFQYLFHSYIKFLVNALFVFCSFIVLAGSDFVASDLLLDFYVYGIIIFILILRIMFSQVSNKKTCDICERCVFIPSGADVAFG